MANIWIEVKTGKEKTTSKIKEVVEELGAEFYGHEYGNGTISIEISANGDERGNSLVRLLRLLKSNTKF